jgi:hypothetical protein
MHGAAGDVDEVVRAGDARLLSEEDLDLPQRPAVSSGVGAFITFLSFFGGVTIAGPERNA